MIRYKLDDELLKALREQGYTYQRIVEYLKTQGIEVNLGTIRTRIMEIYAEEKKEVPRGEKKKIIDVPDEELIKLLEEGLTYQDMVEELNKKRNKNHSTNNL